MLTISHSLICLHLNILCLNHSFSLDILKVLHKEKHSVVPCRLSFNSTKLLSVLIETTRRKENIHC